MLKFGRTVKFWCGGDHLAKKHHCPRKKPELGRKEEFGEKGKNWKEVENLTKFGKGRKKLKKLERIGKIWNLDFVSLNRPGTC